MAQLTGTKKSVPARARAAKIMHPPKLFPAWSRLPAIGYGPGDGLADPPRSVRRELVLGVHIEIGERPNQPEVSLLHKVDEPESGTLISAADRHDQPELRLDQPLLGDLRGRLIAGMKRRPELIFFFL